MAGDHETEVLVLGAGPVGMMAAICLSDSGVRVRIVDKYHRAALHSYAPALHAETLGILDELAIAAPLVAAGQAVERIAVHHGRDQVADIDISCVGGQFPFVLVVPQTLLEAALEKRLEENGVQVERGHMALSFESGTEDVRTLVGRTAEEQAVDSSVEYETFSIRSAFLIGADGYDSITRRLLELECTSGGPASNHGLIEFRTALESPRQMRLVFGEETTDVLWPLGEGVGRWGVQLPDGSGPPDVQDLKDLVRDRAPWFGSGFDGVDWVTGIRFDRRLVRRFGRDRVWLAGDSAHSTSPIGVQGMNVGLREARGLAGRIVSILRRGSPMKLLDNYSEQRRREWRLLLGVRDAMEIRPDAPPWAPTLAGRLLVSLPATGRDLNRMLGQVGLRAAMGYWRGAAERAWRAIPSGSVR